MTNKMRKGWEIKRLKEVCEKITDGTHQTPTYFDSGYIFLSSGNVTSGTINWDKIKYIDEQQHLEMQKRVSPKINDILLAKNGTTGVAAMVNRDVDFDIYVSLALLRPIEVITPHYLLYFINSPLAKAQFNSRLKGAGVPNLHLNEIREVEIPFPNDKEEQQRIISILDEAFSSIEQVKENLQRNLQNAKELFQSESRTTFLDKISGINFEALDSLCELIVDCEHKTAPTQAIGYPSIRTPNIGKGVLILDNVNRVSEETYIEWTRRAIPQANDLILAREAPAGNVAVIPENLEVCLGQRTVLIRPKKDKFNSSYLAYLLLSKDVQEAFLSHSRGATVEHINMKDIRAFKIYNLSSIETQQKIVQQLDKLSTETKRLEAMYQQKLDALEELKKSILQKAFSGELSGN
jgi:type I restriction enzyme, S subunit